MTVNLAVAKKRYHGGHGDFLQKRTSDLGMLRAVTSVVEHSTWPERFRSAPGAELDRTTRDASIDVVHATKLQKVHRLPH